MLRCGLRVQEVAKLTLASVDLKRAQVFVYHGKGAKQRVVYLSKDAYQALLAYLKVRPFSRAKRLFLANKGRFRGQPGPFGPCLHPHNRALLSGVQPESAKGLLPGNG